MTTADAYDESSKPPPYGTDVNHQLRHNEYYFDDGNLVIKEIQFVCSLLGDDTV